MKKNAKKLIENPIMSDNKKIKKVSFTNSSDEGEIKSFIIIIVVISILISAIYGITEALNKDKAPEETIVAGKVNYDKISIGTLFNRKLKEYYVLIYNSDADDAVLYSTITSKYNANKEKDGFIKLYYCDLSNSLNNKYYDVNEDGKSNPKATNINELDLGYYTLLKIKDGKIVKYVENYDEIKKILK